MVFFWCSLAFIYSLSLQLIVHTHVYVLHCNQWGLTLNPLQHDFVWLETTRWYSLQSYHVVYLHYHAMYSVVLWSKPHLGLNVIFCHILFFRHDELILICLIEYAAAWRRRDLSPGPPDTNCLLCHLCYLMHGWSCDGGGMDVWVRGVVWLSVKWSC